MMDFFTVNRVEVREELDINRYEESAKKAFG
jgi:hypothetical protein